MKIFFLLHVLLLGSTFSFSQDIDKIITVEEATRIENILASDEMQGRKAFSSSIDKAADFIEEEFGKYGLRHFPGLGNYRQTFHMYTQVMNFAEALIDNVPYASDKIIALTNQTMLNVNEDSGYKKSELSSSVSFMKEVNRLIRSGENYIVFVNNAHSKDFRKLERFKKAAFDRRNNIIFVLSDQIAKTFSFNIRHTITKSALSNVVGMIPGKTKPGEYVIFSAHYDHLGTGKPDSGNDSVYNGANDDASGTTAIMMLANYFSRLKNTGRTILFTAFTAEEAGGFGSTYFSGTIEPDSVIAMFNIEMIGTESKWGTNSAYVTGYDKSDFGKILQHNLAGSPFHFEPDPYPQENLFYRSDNATLAVKGVPAHTISTSKMDSEKYYHTQDDEIQTLDMKNMTEIIKAIAISSSTLLSGEATPIRIRKEK